MEDTQVETSSNQEFEDSIRKHLGEGAWRKDEKWKGTQVNWTEDEIKKAAAELADLHTEEKGNLDYMKIVLETRLKIYKEHSIFKDDEIRTTILMSVVEELLARKQERRTPRVASLLTGMDIKLSHDLDVIEFLKQIEKVAKWHNGDHTKYAFPYFALIQSSGMGKTRLLKEAKERLNDRNGKYTNMACKLIYCHDDATELTKEESNQEVYDMSLKVSRSFDELSSELNKQCPKQEFSILLFDEAQLLIEHGDDGQGSMFQRLRWWLRDTSHGRVVAVFTGTSSRLSNFFPVAAPTQLRTSRDDRRTYVGYHGKEKELGKILYPPWFMLRTIGCLRNAFNDIAPTHGGPALLVFSAAVSRYSAFKLTAARLAFVFLPTLYR